MGSCQSTANNGGVATKVAGRDNVAGASSSAGGSIVNVNNNSVASSPLSFIEQERNRNTNGHDINTAITDPAAASQQSLDEESIRSNASGGGGGGGGSGGAASITRGGGGGGAYGGYSSGGSTSAARRDSGSHRSLGDRSNGSISESRHNPKCLSQSNSVIGLDSMIENRRETGDLTINMVHMEVPFGKPIEEVYDGVHSGPVLGSGISGLVRLVTHKATGVKYAVKCLDLGLVDTSDGLAQLREEIFIMCQLDHPNIVRLEEVYESHSEIYLVQELCLGGELFDRLDEQPDYHYTEAECARLVKQMLCAVRYLHSKGIIHRDLKLENFLFSSTSADSELKMIDFGLSKHFSYGEVQHQAVGTPYTVAPEVIRGSYDERCDIWAIGVIAFLLFSGEPPFGGCGGPEPLATVRSNILRGDFSFEPEDIWEVVSASGKDFIEAMLVVDPQRRPTAKDAQQHPWLIEWANRTRSEDDTVLNPNVVKALVNFKEFSDMRKLLCEVLSFTLLPDQIAELRKQFEVLDTDGSGEISLAALKEVLVTNAGAGSLGALTESEVEDIFNAMRVNKAVTRIHWHEFIAAGLSQCQVDDRNLRLAFDRLDGDHKGYVTLDDIMDLLGSDALHSEEMMMKMWGDSMKAVNCSEARITYDDFLLLMKGQTKEPENDPDDSRRSSSSHRRESSDLHGSQQLVSVPENLAVESPEPGITASIMRTSGGNLAAAVPTSQFLAPAGAVSDIPLVSDFEDGPLSMDDDDDMQLSPAVGSATSPLSEFTPPTTPIRGAFDYLSPRSSSSRIKEFAAGDGFIGGIPELPPRGSPVIRKRSRSMDDDDQNISRGKPPSPIPKTTVALPVNGSKVGVVAINVMNDNGYMRDSVLQACKLFEEQQTRHARDVLIAKQEADENRSSAVARAGLVMRRVENRTIPSDDIKKLLDDYQRERQAAMAKATRRGGRGRHTRKKTISDMSGMLVASAPDGLSSSAETSNDNNDVSPPPASFHESQTASAVIPSVISVEPTPEEQNLRSATVPGEFRKVNDPFGARGKYGRTSVEIDAAIAPTTR